LLDDPPGRHKFLIFERSDVVHTMDTQLLKVVLVFASWGALPQGELKNSLPAVMPSPPVPSKWMPEASPRRLQAEAQPAGATQERARAQPSAGSSHATRAQTEPQPLAGPSSTSRPRAKETVPPSANRPEIELVFTYGSEKQK
jgi:hypothetical protein